tara:strand:- start:3028 stop:3780 length:753 start_codon:yes stop_codon:yes gene_type:complete
MKSKNLIIYVLVGMRDFSKLIESIKIARSFNYDIDIKVYHDCDKSLIEESLDTYSVQYRKYKRKKYPIREENRNSSLWRLVSILENKDKYESILYLDNDIFIVHKGFFEGFDISKNFGICMVQNPRMFIKTYEGNIGDLDIGTDVLPFDKMFVTDMPSYMTSYNMGVMFYSNTEKSSDFLAELLWEQQNNPSRGQAGLYRTIWKTKLAPYCLPINWLVCKKHANIDNPLSLHVGHGNVFKRWLEEYKVVI